MYNRPLRRTTLHFEQRGRIDDDTFILPYSFSFSPSSSQSFDYNPVRSDRTGLVFHISF